MVMQEHLGEMERLYGKLNRREYVHPDPLEFLYDYEDQCDREVVAMVASSLAYGRVAQILKSVSLVLGKLGPHPAGRLAEFKPAELQRLFQGFLHRYSAGDHVAAMLSAIAGAIRRFGSLEACFRDGDAVGRENVITALEAFVERLAEEAHGDWGNLLPSPAKGSACKRLHLMLRWLVRHDDVDPGGWTCVRPEQLIVPLDTHMHRIALEMGLTKRKTPDIRTALEVTDAFRRICPADPVKYDFALTRLGIRDDVPIPEFLACYNARRKTREVAHA